MVFDRRRTATFTLILNGCFAPHTCNNKAAGFARRSQDPSALLTRSFLMVLGCPPVSHPVMTFAAVAVPVAPGHIHLRTKTVNPSLRTTLNGD